MDPQEELYPCVGVCMADPDSGYCLGCGRPPLATPESAKPSVSQATQAPATNETPTPPEAR